MSSFIRRLKKPARESVGLFLHPRRRDAIQYAQTELIPFLKTKKIEVCINTSGTLFNIAIGGDGSLLGVFRHYPKRAVPAIGIQTGDATSMLELTRKQAIEQLKQIFQGQLRLVRRLRLSATLSALAVGQDEFKNTLYQMGRGQPVLFTAFNEMVIGSLDRKVLSVDCFIDGNLQFPIVGDGVIIATPTGSTGYSLSAGGPAVEFSSNNIVVTPVLPLDRITPHWVFEASHRFGFRFKVDSNRRIGFCVDGINHAIAPGLYQWEFKKSPYSAQLIRVIDRPFQFARAVYTKGKIYRK